MQPVGPGRAFSLPVLVGGGASWLQLASERAMAGHEGRAIWGARQEGHWCGARGPALGWKRCLRAWGAPVGMKPSSRGVLPGRGHGLRWPFGDCWVLWHLPCSAPQSECASGFPWIPGWSRGWAGGRGLQWSWAGPPGQPFALGTLQGALLVTHSLPQCVQASSLLPRGAVCCRLCCLSGRGGQRRALGRGPGPSFQVAGWGRPWQAVQALARGPPRFLGP